MKGGMVSERKLTEGFLHLLAAPDLVHKLPLEGVHVGVELRGKEGRRGGGKKEKVVNGTLLCHFLVVDRKSTRLNSSHL